MLSSFWDKMRAARHLTQHLSCPPLFSCFNWLWPQISPTDHSWPIKQGQDSQFCLYKIKCFKSHISKNKQTKKKPDGKYVLCSSTEIRWQSEPQPVVISPKQIQLQHRFFNRKVSLIFMSLCAHCACTNIHCNISRECWGKWLVKDTKFNWHWIKLLSLRDCTRFANCLFEKHFTQLFFCFCQREQIIGLLTLLSKTPNAACNAQYWCLCSMSKLYLCFGEQLNCLKHAHEQHARVMIPQGLD